MATKRGPYKSDARAHPKTVATRKRKAAVEPPPAPTPEELAAEAEAEAQRVAARAIAEAAAARRDLMAVERLLKVRRAQTRLRPYIELTMPDPAFPDDPNKTKFVCKPHHGLLIGAVEAVERGDLMRSCYSLPPQVGKTTILGLNGVAWIIGKNPHMKIIIGVYSEERAEKVGSELRDLLQSEIHAQIFPGCVMKKGSKAKTDMEFEGGGYVLLRGRGTGTTGQACDLFLIDDPIKDDKEAASPAIRKAVQAWYSSVVFTRCPSTTPIMIVHTRWNEDDLIGWLTDPDHPINRLDPDRIKRWKYLNIPSIVDDPKLAKALGVKVGSALWPEKFPLSHLKEARGNDPRVFSAIYMGRPSPDDGDLYKTEHFVPYSRRELPDIADLRIYAASDHAVGTTERNNPSCMLIVGVDRDRGSWILDCAWKRMDSMEAVKTMVALMKKWKPLIWWAERGHISKSIGPFLRMEMRKAQTYINVVEVTPIGDKVQRTQSIAGRMSMGMVRFPANAPWFEAARSQMLKFPNASEDDFVDTMSLIGLGLDAQVGPGARASNDNAGHVAGTFGWLMRTARQQRENDAMKRRLAGM